MTSRHTQGFPHVNLREARDRPKIPAFGLSKTVEHSRYLPPIAHTVWVSTLSYIQRQVTNANQGDNRPCGTIRGIQQFAASWTGTLNRFKAPLLDHSFGSSFVCGFCGHLRSQIFCGSI